MKKTDKVEATLELFSDDEEEQVVVDIGDGFDNDVFEDYGIEESKKDDDLQDSIEGHSVE